LPARRKSTRKIKEVLRLRNELKLEQRQIARSCSLSVSTVHEYLKRAAAANIGWPLPDGWDDTRLAAALFPPSDVPPRPTTRKSPPDFAAVHEQLQRHRHVTLQLVWEEYRDANQDGYGYSRFCELYQRWRKKLDVVLRQEHKAGEKAFVDWAGATMPIHDRDTGNVWQASLFIATLGASSYTWAEVTRDLVAVNAKDEDLWRYNGDHLRRWTAEHREQLQRWSEEQKYEQRPVPAFAQRREAAVRKFRDRMNSATHEIAAELAGYAARRHFAQVRYDDSDHSYLGDGFPWYRLRSLIAEKLDARGIALEASTQPAQETAEPLVED